MRTTHQKRLDNKKFQRQSDCKDKLAKVQRMVISKKYT